MEAYRLSFIQWIKDITGIGTASWDSAIVMGSEIKQPEKILKNTATLSITRGQITMFWVIGVGIAYVAYLVFNSLSLIYLIITGLLISIAMETFIARGEKWTKRGVSIGITYLLFLIFMLTGLIIILPFLLKQISTILSLLIAQMSLMGQKISLMGLTGYVQSLEWIPGLIKEYIVSSLGPNATELQSIIMKNISLLISTGTAYASNIGSMALSFVWSIFTVLGQIALVLTIAIFFSIEKDRVIRFFVYHTASTISYTNFMSEKVDLFYKKMGTWLKTQLWLCLYIFVVVYLSLLLLSWFGMPLPSIFSLALMAWFTEFIPYIGPLLGAIPAVIVATLIYWWKWFVVVSIIYIIIQQIENNILVPMLMNKSLGVSPLLILLSALFFGSILWFIGVLMAVPFAILITMVVKKDFQ